MTSLTKNPHPPTKNFFRVQATRLAAYFETLTESVELTGPEKYQRKATCVSVFFSRNSPKVTRCQSVKCAKNTNKTLVQHLTQGKTIQSPPHRLAQHITMLQITIQVCRNSLFTTCFWLLRKLHFSEKILWVLNRSNTLQSRTNLFCRARQRWFIHTLPKIASQMKLIFNFFTDKTNFC